MHGGEQGKPTADDLALMARLYTSHAESLLRFCYRLSGDSDLAQDLLMETIQAVPRAISRFEKRSSIKTWLFRIALNKWREAARSTSRSETLCGVERPEPQTDRDLAIIIDEELRQLPEPLVEAFTLVRMEGLKYREAAEVLEIPIGTVQSRVHAACEHLRMKLGGSLE